MEGGGGITDLVSADRLIVRFIIIIMERKHTRKTLPLKTKIKLIQEVEDNPTKLTKTLANEFGIPSCTLTTIMHHKENLYKKQHFGGEENVCRKRVRGAQHQQIEDSLLHWFTQARYSNCTFIL